MVLQFSQLPQFSRKRKNTTQRRGPFRFTFIEKILRDKERLLIYFFMALFGIVLIRLFDIQVLKHKRYSEKLSTQHYKESLLQAERGNIFVLDKGGHPIQLTENIPLYDLALDPKEIGTFSGNISMKSRLIDIISPVIYQHLCVLNGMKEVSQEECVKNVALFAGIELLPQKPDFFYYGSGEYSPEYDSFDFTGYEEKLISIVSGFSQNQAIEYITQKLHDKIKIGEKSSNYLGYFTDSIFLKELESLHLPYVSIEKENYVYILPRKISNEKVAIDTLKTLLMRWGYNIGNNFENLFTVQEWRYIKLVSGLNPHLAQEIRNLKITYQYDLSEKTKERPVRTPILYGIILEPYMTRYYPYGNFLSNVLGYVDSKGVAYYGIEQYFDEILKGKPGEIKGRTSSRMGNVGANEFEIIDPIIGEDIYLTIDIRLQREAEKLANEYLKLFRADSLNILVMDVNNGEVKASVGVPSFNPNDYNEAYTLKPLGIEEAYILDDLSYADVPIYSYSGGEYKVLTSEEKNNPEIKKYVAKNIYGSQVFVDKNISMPFEPGSTFKAFTIAMGLDSDEITLSETYIDEGFVKVGERIIQNAEKICMGTNTFLRAFVHSCNVGMVKIVQKIGKYAFFNYLDKLGFGKLSGIQLAGEKAGFVDDVNIVSFTRFLNNAFGQGLTTTQIQLAVGYSTIVNGGFYIQPSIVKNIVETKKNGEKLIKTPQQEKKQIFKNITSEKVREALLNVLQENPEVSNNASISGYALGGKSGTAQISYKGRYQGGIGRTNGTFSGIIDVDNPKYVIVIRARRPRSNQWGGRTAGRVFKSLAQYLITYDL